MKEKSTLFLLSQSADLQETPPTASTQFVSSRRPGLRFTSKKKTYEPWIPKARCLLPLWLPLRKRKFAPSRRTLPGVSTSAQQTERSPSLTKTFSDTTKARTTSRLSTPSRQRLCAAFTETLCAERHPGRLQKNSPPRECPHQVAKHCGGQAASKAFLPTRSIKALPFFLKPSRLIS